MAKKQGGLGRDFYSVLDDNMLDAKAESNIELSLSVIEPRSDQPRKDFDLEALQALADSIAEHGVLQPIIVRENEFAAGTYQIIAGERRWRASKLAGKETIPSIILTGDDLKVAQVSLVENVQRKDLNPVEEAFAYKALIDGFGLTQDEVAKQAGKSRSSVANMLRLIDLPDEVLQLLRDDMITTGHARTLLGLENKDDIVVLANDIVEKELSVREVEKLVKIYNDRANSPVGDETPKKTSQKDVYMRDIEIRAMQALGRRVRINATARKKTLELTYEDNEDLENVLKALCGDDFFAEN